MSRLSFATLSDPLDGSLHDGVDAARKAWIASNLAQVGRHEPLRILISSNTLGCGGAEHQILRSMPWLERYGISVEHFYYGDDGDSHFLRPRFEELGLCTHFIHRNKIGLLNFFNETVQLMRERRFDVVHAFTGTANLYARAAAFAARVPVILGGWRNRPMSRRERFYYGWLNPLGCGWIINAKSNGEALEEMRFIQSQRVYVVPNALEFDPREDAQSVPLDSRTKEWINDRMVVATVGSLSDRKNFDMFIDVAARVSAKRNDVCFILVGGGASREDELETRLRRRVEEERLGDVVRFLGRSDNVPGFLPHVAVLLCTSKFEGCPNVVLEAMRARLPVVMTDCTDTELLIQPGRSGYVTGLDDVAEMAARTNELLDDAPKRREFGETAGKMVEAHFEASNNAWLLARIYVEEWLRRRGLRC